MTEGPYTRVYWKLFDEHPEVVDDDAALAAWLRLLVAADQAWPTSAYLPRGIRARALTTLSQAGLIERGTGDRYRVRGMDKERAKRRAQAKDAATGRWSNADSNAQSIPVSTAETMPSRAEPSQAETSQAKPSPEEKAAGRDRGRPSPPPRPVTLSKEQLEAWKAFGPQWEPFKRAWLNRGFLWPPFGEQSDDDTTQRGLLYQVLDARPTSLAEWVRLAPSKGTAREVIQFVLDRFHEIRAAVEEEPPERQMAPTKQEAVESLGNIIAHRFKDPAA